MYVMCTHIIGERRSKIHAIIVNSSLNHKMMISLDVSGSGKRQLFRSFPDGKGEGIFIRKDKKKKGRYQGNEYNLVWLDPRVSSGDGEMRRQG